MRSRACSSADLLHRRSTLTPAGYLPVNTNRAAASTRRPAAATGDEGPYGVAHHRHSVNVETRHEADRERMMTTTKSRWSEKRSVEQRNAEGRANAIDLDLLQGGDIVSLGSDGDARLCGKVQLVQ